MKNKIIMLLKDRRGENYIDIAVVVIVVVMCIALILAVVPVLIAKSNLDHFAKELAREAEIVGEIGSATTAKANKLKTQTGLNPTITWDKSGKIQLNSEFMVTLKATVNIGFGGLGSFPITLTSKASGKSEVYYKS